jgi:hypothetical protein
VGRLNKLSIVRRLLFGVKAQLLGDALLPDVMLIVKLCLKANFAVDTVKSICTFLIATLPKDYNRASEIPDDDRGLPKVIHNVKSVEPPSRNIFIRNLLLELLYDLMIERDTDYSQRFATMITNRWMLLFISSNLHPYTTVTALRILATLWQCQKPASVATKFKDVFVILSHTLSKASHIMQIYPPLFAILCGGEISNFPLDLCFSSDAFKHALKGIDLSRKRPACPDAAQVVMSLLKRTVTLTIKGPPEDGDNRGMNVHRILTCTVTDWKLTFDPFS